MYTFRAFLNTIALCIISILAGLAISASLIEQVEASYHPASRATLLPVPAVFRKGFDIGLELGPLRVFWMDSDNPRDIVNAAPDLAHLVDDGDVIGEHKGNPLSSAWMRLHAVLFQRLLDVLEAHAETLGDGTIAKALSVEADHRGVAGAAITLGHGGLPFKYLDLYVFTDHCAGRPVSI